MLRFFRTLRMELLSAAVVFLLLLLKQPGEFWPSLQKVLLALGVFAGLILSRALIQSKGIIDLLVPEDSSDSVRSSEIARKFFVSEAINNLRHKLEHGREWLILNSHELSRYTRLCFNHCPGKYVGTDLHLPSQFAKVYPFYLLSQSERETAPGDVRILFVEKAALEADMRAHHKEVADFVVAHMRDGIQLLIVDPKHVTKLAKTLNLETPEFGIFSWHFIVYFKSNGNDSYAVKAVDIDQSTRRHLKMFFESILTQAESVVWRNDTLAYRSQTGNSAQILLDEILS